MKKDAPKVSVIMAVYNSERTVGESIESILHQSFADFEFVICDDGSRDNTRKILYEYAAADPRIVVVENKKNSGTAHSLNHCIDRACGQYLARMDGDDIAVPDRFQKQVEFLDARPDIAVCGSWVTYFDDAGPWGMLRTPIEPEKSSFLRGSPFAHPTVIMRAHVLDEIGRYSESPKTILCEDMELFMRLYASGYKGYNIPEALLNYREDLTAIRRRTFKRSLNDATVRWRGFRSLGLLPQGIPWVFRPLIIGMFPHSLYQRVRKSLYSA